MATQKLGVSALMKSIYDRLETDAFTTKYPVYNFTPRSATFPYISFGSPIAVKSAMLSTRDTNAEDISVTVHVWSDAPGDKEAGNILHLVVDAILGTSLEVMEYFAPVFAELDYSEIAVDTSDPSRPVRHGIARFRFNIAPS